MVDYVRLFWRDKERFEHFVCQEENFKDVDTLFGLHTGQIKYPYRTSFNSMDVRVTAKYGFVSNSMHKAFNDKCGLDPHNYNDFGYENIYEMVDYIHSKVTDIKKSSLTQLEFGLNIATSTPAEQIIRHNVLMHKLNGFNHNRVFNGRGELKQFDYHSYLIKVYDKAKQYNLSQNLLRFEVRFQKRKELQKLEIFRLEDLKDKTKLRGLFIVLLKRFDELTIVDSYNEANIPQEDLSKLIRYCNPQYWETRIRGYSNTTKMRHKRAFDVLLRKHNLLTVKSALREQLISKYLHLINF